MNEEIMNEIQPVRPKDQFTFSCHQCGECCRNIEGCVMVESLDAYRLARYLRAKGEPIEGIEDFLFRYCDPEPLTEEGFPTCYGDIYKTVNALRDYVRLLESVCDQWELTGFHRATYEYHAEKLRKIADKLQAGIGYDYDKAVERCKKKRARKSHSNDVGEDALLLTVRAAGKSADNEKEAAPYEEDTPWEPELE